MQRYWKAKSVLLWLNGMLCNKNRSPGAPIHYLCKDKIYWEIDLGEFIKTVAIDSAPIARLAGLLNNCRRLASRKNNKIEAYQIKAESWGLLIAFSLIRKT